MAKKKKEKPLGYICGNAVSDIPANDVVIYETIKALKAERECWKECGIVEVVLGKTIVNGTD